MKGCKFYGVLSLICFTRIGQSSSADVGHESILPPCKACTVFIDSVRSAKQNEHSGGSALQSVCSDVGRGQRQCYDLLASHAAEIEDHWKGESPDLFDTLCIEKLKVCCPPDHFGPNCEKCEDCSKNGKCKGAGTRKGNGKCSCNPGYTGENCRECAVLYYAAFKDATKLLCSQCHKSCTEEGCTSSGPQGCISCRPAWRMTSNGCGDINECLETRNICTTKQFCVNNDGSYSCLECDRSCNGCDGDGPDMCKSCADGYTLIDGKCTDDSMELREQYVNMTRFFTYLGLCIATCVIFQSSTTKAYMVGAAVATYIAASEYWLNTTPTPADLKSQMNTKKLEDLIMNLL